MSVDAATMDLLLQAAGLTPEHMRRLDAVVAATARACDGDTPDAIATLTMALALFAGLTRNAPVALTAAISGLERARDAYQQSATRARSVPS